MPSLTASPTAARILHCALDLFATRGYDATAVREICEAAAITKPTLYHFFGSKDGVFRALVGGALDEMHEAVRRGLASDAPLADRLRDVVRTTFAAAREHPLLWRFVFGTVWCPTRAPLEELHRRYEEMNATLAQALEQSAASGEIAPGPIAVRQLICVGAVSEALSRYLILGHPDLTNDLADALVDDIVGPWLVTPRTPSTATRSPEASEAPPLPPDQPVP